MDLNLCTSSDHALYLYQAWRNNLKEFQIYCADMIKKRKHISICENVSLKINIRNIAINFEYTRNGKQCNFPLEVT